MIAIEPNNELDVSVELGDVHCIVFHVLQIHELVVQYVKTTTYVFHMYYFTLVVWQHHIIHIWHTSLRKIPIFQHQSLLISNALHGSS